MQIYKFGGASVKDAEGVRHIAKIVSNQSGRLMIVISAMGKMTNAFEQLVRAYYEGHKHNSELRFIEKFHLNMIQELELDDSSFYNYFKRLKSLLETPSTRNFNFEYDKLICFGELFSTLIIQQYFIKQGIRSEWLDIRNLIKTDSNYRFARVNWDLTAQNIQKNLQKSSSDIFLTQGFIASDKQGNSTSLGREGSDYSAAILAYVTNAKELTIWKDVPGILNADPRIFKTTDLIKELSYHEAIELAFFGAQVIHPKTIHPLKNKSIRLKVKSFIHPEKEGSLVSSFQGEINSPIIIIKENQALLSFKMPDFSFVDESNISHIFKIFSQYNAKVNLMQNSAVSFSVAIDYQEMHFETMLSNLEQHFEIRYNKGLKLITVRHYTQEKLDELIKDSKIFLEQKTRNTAQYLVLT